MSNIVYIATSLDGYIADKNGSVDWLHATPNPDGSDLGYSNFIERIDALVMGRNTLDMVLNFDCDWPYTRPVFVLSNTMTRVPEGYEDKIFLVKGSLVTVVASLNEQGYNNLYIDGGITIQNFLKEDLIDEMIITTIPVLLGGGSPLFGELVTPLSFELTDSETLINQLVQSHFTRVR